MADQSMRLARGWTRRHLLAGGLGSVTALLLAACGGAASPTAAPAKAEPTKPADAKPADAKPATDTKPAAGVSGGTPVAPAPTLPPGAKVVTFWIPWGQPERQKWVTDWGAKFNEKYPDQALKMEFVGFGNMRQRWIAAHQANQMPEVLNTSFPELGAAYVAGALERADDVVKDLGGQFLLDGPLTVWQYQGAYYGIPHYVFPRMFYYRKDLYEAKGQKPPTDWETWYSGAKALTEPPDRFGSSLAPSSHAPEVIDYLMRGQGSAMFDKDGKPLLDTPEGLAAIEMFAKLIKDTGPQGMPNYIEDDQVKLFLSKDVGSIITWPALLQWTAQQAPQNVKNLGAIVPPAKTAGAKLKPVATNIGFALGKGTKNLDGARKYLNFIMQDEPHLAFLHSIAGVFPVTKSVAASPKFPENPILRQYPEVVKTSLEASNDGIEAGYAHGFNPVVTLALNTNPGLPQMLQAITLQGTPVKAAVDEQVKRMNAAIAQGRR
jgi:multiple sugar transport system substrate-binding protein